MKTFIPHVYFSAPEDTVGDLVNQIRRESEIPGTAEPKPEMKDSGKKSIIPKTVVSAPEKDTVGDLIEQLHKEPEAIPEEKPEEKTEQPEKTEGKKSIIPKTVVSAAKSELDRVYDLLTSGEDLQMNPDGTLSPASAPKKRAKPAPGSEPKAPVKTKKEIIPHTVVSAPEKDTVGDLIEQLHKEPEPLPEEQPEEKAETPEKTDGKKSIIPKTIVSAPVQQWYKTNKALYNAEVAAMRKEFNDPNMQPHFMSDGRMYWLVKTRPNLGRGFNTMTAADTQCHVVEVIERVVAAVKVLRGDFRNALHRARNVVLDRVRVVHGAQQAEHHAPLRVIVIHFDFLADDAELFFNGLLCKIRGLHEVEQNLQRLLCVFRAGEQVARRLKRRIRVCGSTDLGIAAECVAVFAFKKLVLQKMRDARGCRLCLRFVAAFKDLIDGAVARSKHRIRTAHFRFRVYKHGQAACVFDATVAVPKKFAFHKGILHFCAHFAAPFSL